VEGEVCKAGEAVEGIMAGAIDKTTSLITQHATGKRPADPTATSMTPSTTSNNNGPSKNGDGIPGNLRHGERPPFTLYDFPNISRGFFDHGECRVVS
jgi:hypothetical protein